MNEVFQARVVNEEVLASTLAHLRGLEEPVRLPRFSELADPSSMEPERETALAAVDPDARTARNLFRVHWWNARDRVHFTSVPEHVVLCEELTGVPARIVVLLGDLFPMIAAHKVLAAYGCLVPRLVTGQFDAQRERAIWPSTGNYCRGGVAIARLLGCRGVAVLPEGMSSERFEWLGRWVSDAEDIVRTQGTESNVKEIYDACHELDREPGTVIFNQFQEFGNHLAHVTCTAPALLAVFDHLARDEPDLSLAAFISATGSAGTLGAGDVLKELHGTRIVAAEARECPTMLENGFGEHNIQGIGDKHIPYIHNVMNTDLVSAVSDRSCDALHVLFASEEGRAFLARERGVSDHILGNLHHLGLSSICNVLAAIETAKNLSLTSSDVLMTVATDGAAMYSSDLPRIRARDFGRGFEADVVQAAFARHLFGRETKETLVLEDRDRRRIFNLGYYTWVEQQGVSQAAFEERRSQDFWRSLRSLPASWDQLIDAFNGELRV